MARRRAGSRPDFLCFPAAHVGLICVRGSGRLLVGCREASSHASRWSALDTLMITSVYTSALASSQVFSEGKSLFQTKVSDSIIKNPILVSTDRDACPAFLSCGR